MSHIPAGWTKTRIGALCNLVNGRAFKPTDWTDDGLPIVRIQNLNNRDAPFNHFKGEVNPRFLLYGGELLFAWSGTSGTSFGAHVWYGGKAVLNQHIFRVEFDENLMDKRFFRYAINQTLDELISIAHGGVGLRHVTKGKFENTEVPVPPLVEQRRIADTLDRLLARVDACRARLARVPALLKRFRQAVLAAAVAGRLTEDWRRENPELVSNQQLIDRLSQRISKNGQSQLRLNDDERFIAADLPPGWQFVPVGLVGDVYLGRQRSPDNHNGPHMRPYVRAANITWQGWDLSDVKEMNFDPKDFARYKLQVGDVLINEGSGSADEVGKPAIWKGDIEDCCFQNTLICVRPHEEMSDFLYYVFLHAAMSKSFVEDTRGVNIFHIGKDRFSAYSIPLPSLAEQHEIVRRAETLFAYADRLEARLAAAQARVAQLTPSLLGKAFRGELGTTTTDGERSG